LFRSIMPGKRLAHLTEAFNSDGFEVAVALTYNGRIGITAENRSVMNYDTGKPKKAYYVEGTPYETGYLMGLMAEDEVTRMMEYTDRVAFSFIGSKVLEKMKLIQSTFIRIMHELSKKTWNQLPDQIRDEVRGICDGCKSRNPKTRVSMERLIVLNTGIDILCSMIYTGNFFRTGMEDLEPEDFDIPFMCNAFTVCGKSAGDSCFFGRDFSFPSADVFHDTAALIVYSPVKPSGAADANGSVLDGRDPLPFVNLAAPGMIGSIAAMNLRGVAFGVNMSPGANCDPENIGINSLLMTRLCVEYGKNAADAASLMSQLPKGVSWLYVIADGNGRSCIAEAGAPWPKDGPVRYPAEEYRPLLPDAKFLETHPSVPHNNGIMFRWNDFRYQKEYLAFNQQLWKHYNEREKKQNIIHDDAFDETGYINRTGEHNCPSTFYFAPQREESDELLVATNHYIIPEMRFFAMHRWTQRVIGKRADDIQWRYDELNRQIHDRLKEKRSIDISDARELISFLAPYGKYKDYYADNPKSRNGRETRIEGAVSVFELKSRVVESHYGYYCDKWVRVTLPAYF
jgi:hypothetical protein